MRIHPWKLGLSFIFLCSLGFAQEPIGEWLSFHLETPHPYPSNGSEDKPVWTDIIYHPDASLIKVHFAEFDLHPKDWVIVRSLDGKFSYTYREKGPLKRGEFHATYIPGEAVVIELYAPSVEGGYGYRIDGYAWGYKDALPPSLESVCGSQDWRNAACYSGTMYQKAKAVTRYIFQDGAFLYACTGWLVGCEGHVLSNNHCISRQRILDTADFEFMAEGNCNSNCDSWGACPGPVWSGTKTFVTTNSSLDYSLYLLGGNPQNTYGYLQARTSGPVQGEEIYIAEHPNAWGKKIAYDSDQDAGGKCKVVNLNNNSCANSAPGLHYYCDTAGGSSGSPVIATSDYSVVGLHNCGGCTNSGIQIDDVGNDLQSKGLLPQGFWAGTSCGGGCTPPNTPSGLTVTDTCNQVSLSWNKVNGADGYNIYRASSCSGSFTQIGTVSGSNTTTYTDTTVTVGNTYAYVVRAYAGDTTCESGDSNCVTATVEGTPSAPAAPTVTDDCSGLIVSWSPASGATSYNVYRRNNGCGNNGWSQVATGITATSWTDTSVSLGSTYGYYIEAVNSCGTATDGKNACGAGTHNLAYPSAPTNLTATGTCTGIDLAWDAVSGATSYNILRTTNSNCSTGLSQIGTSTTNSYTDTTASAGTTYYYVVQAVNACGASGNSNCASGSALTTPDPPQAPTVTDDCAGLVVSWSPANGATSYNVYRRNNGCGNNGWSQVATGITATSWTDTSVSLGSTYGYYIEAVNSCGTATDGKNACGAGTHNLDVPGQPVITSITDNDDCVQDGIYINYTTGSGATSHDLYKDGALAVTNYTSGALYNPGDTANHTYVIQAINSCGTTDSTGSSFSDAANAPGQPVITSITDNDTCAQDGIHINYTAGSGATSHDLYKNGALAVTGYVSGALYDPGDTATHTYVIRAINGTCTTDSASQNFADENNTPTPTISGPNSNTCPSESVTLTTEAGMSNYQWYLNGNPISGANSDTYVATQSGDYTVSYTNSFGCTGTSAPHSVTITACSVPEVSDDSAHHMKVTKNNTNPDNVDILFEDVGALNYNVYVSTLPNTHAFQVTDNRVGVKYCAQSSTGPDANGMRSITDFSLEQAFHPTADTSKLFILMTGDNGGGTEGILGYDSSGAQRTADSYCAP